MRDAKDRFDLEALRALVAAAPGCPEFPALAEAERRAGDAESARRIAEAGLAAAPGRLAGRVALGLALVDLGRLDEARDTLAVILDAVLEPHRIASAPPEALGDDELEQAFAAAEPEVEAMLSPNHMAERVLLDHAPLDGDVEDFDAAPLEEMPAGVAAFESIDSADPAAGDDDDAAAPAPSSPLFRTATMAELLARQGDVEGAEAIRRELARTPAAPAGQGAAAPLGAVDAAVVPGPAAAPRREAGSGEPLDAARQTRILATLERWLQNIQRGPA
jgi:hypothetical protein